jgi:Zn-dependent peptidase ImmA (M78 family)
LIDNLERYLVVEQILDLRPSTEWVVRRRHAHVVNESEIDEKADALRKEWKLGLDPIQSVCELIEDKGIKVVECDLPEGINGLACQVMGEGKSIAKAVVVSNRVNVERKRFTLAHELAHHIVRSTSSSTIQLEEAKNRFAGAFLVPREHLIAEVGARRNRVTYYEILRLKHIYGVSAATLLIRLGQLDILHPANVRRAFLTFAQSWRTEEPSPIRDDSDFAALERPSRFERLVFQAVGEELISPVRAVELLQKPLEFVKSQINGLSN